MVNLWHKKPYIGNNLSLAPAVGRWPSPKVRPINARRQHLDMLQPARVALFQKYKLPKASASAIRFSSSNVSRQEFVQLSFCQLCQITHFKLSQGEEKNFKTGKFAEIKYEFKFLLLLRGGSR